MKKITTLALFAMTLSFPLTSNSLTKSVSYFEDCTIWFHTSCGTDLFIADSNCDKPWDAIFDKMEELDNRNCRKKGTYRF